MRMFCIIDAKTDSVCMAFSSINEATARRSFEDLIAAPEPSVFSLHPEDFTLYSLLDLGTEKGLPMFLPCMDKICSGSDYSSAVLESLREERRAAFFRTSDNSIKEDFVNE